MYQYDVFISYQRTSPRAPQWIRGHFYPLLSELMDDYVDFEVRIFFDDLTSCGSVWPIEQRTALQRTRILLPICSPKYFLEEWCLAEWHSMARREELTGMATPDQPHGLIYPVIFSDSKHYPEYATNRRMRNCRNWAFPYDQFRVTEGYLDFQREMEQIVEDLVALIDKAPDWRPDWPVETPTPEPPPPTRLPRY